MPSKHIRHIAILITLFLSLKILGYFTISENVAITRVVKILLRVSMTVLVLYMMPRWRKVLDFRQVTMFQLPLYFYLAYLALGIISIGWSSNAGVSMLQWVMVAESLLFAIPVAIIMKAGLLSEDLHMLRPEKTLSYALLFILLWMLIGAWADPDNYYRATRGGEEHRLGGWFMNPNELGMLGGILGALSLQRWFYNQRNFMTVFMFLAAVYTLVLTSSRSSLIAFVLVAGFYVLRYGSFQIIASAIGLGVLATPFALREIIFKAGDVEEVMSMTGRLPFWTALLNEAIIKEPFFGYGFMRIYYTDAFQGADTYPGKMTHNTFIQVLMNLGFVGLFIALSQMFSAMYAAFYRRTKEEVDLFVGMLIPIFVNSVTEFGIFGEANYGILFWQILIGWVCWDLVKGQEEKKGPELPPLQPAPRPWENRATVLRE